MNVILTLFPRYIAEVKEIFDTKMFIFFTFAYLSQILCMYQIRVVSLFVFCEPQLVEANMRVFFAEQLDSWLCFRSRLFC